ncbi:MAG: CehA/McbA family metallohydrolase [Clostridia bacterium]|nr:CehA/McbA family metallohydrolase [Clostridia bacterium]
MMLYYLEHAYLAIEQQIAAIGEVHHDNLAEAGEKITQAEAAVASLMEKMHFTDSDAQDYGKYYFILVRNIFLLEDAREAYNTCLAEAKRGIAVSLTASANETDPGEKVVVTYEVRNMGAAAADYSYSMTYPKIYAALSDESAPIKGKLHLEAGENTQMTFVLTAREGGLLRVEAALCDAAGEMLSERRLDVQIMGAGCYLGTTHSHSTESDGKGTLAQNFHRMIKDGMTLTYTADHNVQTDRSGFMRAMESIQKCGYRFAAIKGCEITVYGNNGHLLSYGNTLTFPEPPRTRGPETIDNWNRIIDEINAAGGYSYLAHPFSRWFNFTGFATDCESTDKMYEVTFHKDILDLYTEMTGIEIINDRYVNKGTDNDYAIAYWDRMNCKGYKKYFCSGGSDGHGLSQLSSVYNGFLLEELTAEALENAYRNGHQFVTTGPELRFTLGDKSFGETLTTDDSKAALTVEAYVKGGYLTEVMLYDYAIDANDPDGAYDNGVQTLLYAHTEGNERDHILCTKELNVRPDHFYRVAVRTNDAEKVAFSNPVWVRRT